MTGIPVLRVSEREASGAMGQSSGAPARGAQADPRFRVGGAGPRLLLDLSPSLVNRTAVYNIAMDCVRLFAGGDVGYQFFGTTMDVLPRPDQATILKRRSEELIRLAENGDREAIRNFAASRPARPNRKSSKFYLDPLYPLYSDLQANDVVLIHDLSPLTTPEWHRSAISLLYEHAFELIAQEQPHIVAVSQNTADTFAANFGYPRRPIQVVHNYVPAHLRLAAEGAEPLRAVDPYFLFVGSLEARKNVKGAVRAFHLTGLAERGWRLLVVGGHGHGAEDVTRLVAATPGVILCGFVSNSELAALYGGASGFVYPSYLEGFGVPLLEAMLYGVPAVASNTGACTEVGGPDVTYCDPDDHASIAEGLLLIASLTPAQRAEIGERSRAWARTHFGFEQWCEQIRRAVALGADK